MERKLNPLEEEQAYQAFILKEMPDIDVKPEKSFGEMKAKALKNIPIERD